MRLRSGDDVNFSSAAFELMVHSMITRAGHVVLSVEPDLQHTTKSPDFHVRAPDGTEYFLELTEARDQAVSERRSQRLQDLIAHRLGSIRSQEFFINIHWRGEVTALDDIRAEMVRIQEWVDGLDYATERARREEPMDRLDRRPRLSVSTTHYNFELSASPRRVPKSDPETCLGMQSFGAKWASSSNALKQSITKKASRYGKLGQPYLIAVNVHDFAIDQDGEMEALFGPLQVVLQIDHSTGEDRVVRTQFSGEGCFLRHGQPTNTRVSGVIIFRSLSALGAGNRSACLYHHPSAQFPVPFSYGEATFRIDDLGCPTRADGASMNHMLGLSEGWPETG